MTKEYISAMKEKEWEMGEALCGPLGCVISWGVREPASPQAVALSCYPMTSRVQVIGLRPFS